MTAIVLILIVLLAMFFSKNILILTMRILQIVVALGLAWLIVVIVILGIVWFGFYPMMHLITS